MKVKGQILAILKNIRNGKYEVTFQMEEDDVGELQELSKLERLSFDIKPFRAKRSLSANAYLHLLIDKIAKKVTPPMSSARTKNVLMSRYGVIDTLEDGTPITLKANIPSEVLAEHETLHTRFVKKTDDGADMYVVLKPTHEMDSKEMSVLIDGVVQEAKDLGITTETPAQIAEMKQRWNIDVES